MTNIRRQNSVREYYLALYKTWGRQHWWPARSRFEVIVGAYLTQNTAWTNVELALRRLRAAGLLNLSGIRNTPLIELESLIRSAGYFRQKAARLKTFVAFLDEYYGGSLNRMFAQPTEKLRQELLALNGIGPETADSILLYAGQHPVFVVDAYTRRILDRHRILPENARYEEIRRLFEDALAQVDPKTRDFKGDENPRPSQKPSLLAGAAHSPTPMSVAKRSHLAQVFNEMHGLIVSVGKNYCAKSKPRCDECPLKTFLPSQTRL